MLFFPQQQNAMGSLHNIDFGVFWASWGGSRKEAGSGNRFRECILSYFATMLASGCIENQYSSARAKNRW